MATSVHLPAWLCMCGSYLSNVFVWTAGNTRTKMHVLPHKTCTMVQHVHMYQDGLVHKWSLSLLNEHAPFIHSITCQQQEPLASRKRFASGHNQTTRVGSKTRGVECDASLTPMYPPHTPTTRLLPAAEQHTQSPSLPPLPVLAVP